MNKINSRSFCTWCLRIIFVSLKRRWFMVLICSICAFLIILMFKWGLMCTSLQPRLHIQNICKSFGNGHIVGNLCPALCEYGSVSSVSCQNFYMGKEAVFSGIWNSNRVIFKSPSKSSIDAIDFKQGYDNSELLISEAEFLSIIKKNIKNKFNVAVNNVEAKKLSNLQYKQNNSKRNTEMANILSLLQDNEYLALTLYEKNDIFPKLLGSCGSMFAVQQLTPISGFWHLITLYESQEEWKKRIRISLKIMEFLNILEHGPSDPLYICDVKMSHFAVTDDMKKIKYLDLDSVHPHSIVDKITGDDSPCTQHGDCDYFDCRSFCNFVTGKCQFGVTNNNIQLVCEKIFLGWVVPDRVIVPGLLLGRHTPLALVELLEKCANPKAESGKPRAATSSQITKRLYNVLIQLSLP